MGIVDKAIQTLEKLGRFDFAIASFITVADSSVKMAISYNPKVGDPTLSQVTAFFNENLSEFTPCLNTCTRKKGEAVVTVFASLKKETRPIADKSKMTPVVAGLTFLDTDLGSIWEVKKGDAQNGNTQVLQQLCKTDVASLIQDRINKMNRVGAKYEVSASVPKDLMVGDEVKFYQDLYNHNGIVRSIKGDKVTIQKTSNPLKPDDVLSQVIVDLDCIYKVTKPLKAKEDAKKEYQKDFYTEVWGPDFSSKLVK